MRSLSSLPRSGREGDRPYTDFLVKFSDKRDIKCLLQSCFVGVVEGVIITNYNTAYAVVPSTIPPEHCFTNQFITRGNYTKTTVVSENSPPPSEPKLARRISFALKTVGHRTVPCLDSYNIQAASFKCQMIKCFVVGLYKDNLPALMKHYVKYTENRIRKEHGLFLRTQYNGW